VPNANGGGPGANDKRGSTGRSRDRRWREHALNGRRRGRLHVLGGRQRRGLNRRLLGAGRNREALYGRAAVDYERRQVQRGD
jgi:hypothetical protein